MKRVAVLASGGGTNLQALIDAARAPGAPYKIVLVVANRPDAGALDRARAAGITARLLDHRGFASRAEFDALLDGALREAAVDLVCLAGFMRVLTPWFTERWRDRLLNIHPSLLPAFPGLDTHARALAASVRVHGCTVHMVRAEVDAGPVLTQGVVPVLPGDDPAALAERVLRLEHVIYPRALALVAEGGLRVDEERVIARDPAVDRARLVVHPDLGP